MFKKITHFIKYNNFTVIILLLILLIGGGAFAQTEVGQEAIGSKHTSVEGTDNTLLIEADINNLDMDFKIERIEEDEEYYYVVYTFLDLVKIDNAWQYQIQEKIRKISKKLREDLGEYISEELKESYEARIKELIGDKKEAMSLGESTRTEVVMYSGLIGQTLSVADKVFPGYESIKTRELPSPSVSPTILLKKKKTVASTETGISDSLADVYSEYIDRMDPDRDNIFGSIDNCPSIPNPDQSDVDDDGIGDVCDLDEEVVATIIEDEYIETTEAEEIVSEDEEAEEIIEGLTEEEVVLEEVVKEDILSTTTKEDILEGEIENVEIIDLDNITNEPQEPEQTNE